MWHVLIMEDEPDRAMQIKDVLRTGGSSPSRTALWKRMPSTRDGDFTSPAFLRKLELQTH